MGDPISLVVVLALAATTIKKLFHTRENAGQPFGLGDLSVSCIAAPGGYG